VRAVWTAAALLAALLLQSALSQIAPGQYGSPWWMAASNGSSWKSKGISRAEMLMDTLGCRVVKPPMRGISQRVPKVGSTARFRLSLPAKLIA